MGSGSEGESCGAGKGERGGGAAGTGDEAESTGGYCMGVRVWELSGCEAKGEGHGAMCGLIFCSQVVYPGQAGWIDCIIM